jgi:hypothetical protein
MASSAVHMSSYALDWLMWSIIQSKVDSYATLICLKHFRVLVLF